MTRLDLIATEGDDRGMLKLRTFVALLCGGVLGFLLLGLIMFTSAYLAGSAATIAFMPPVTLHGYIAFLLWSGAMMGVSVMMAYWMVKEAP